MAKRKSKLMTPIEHAYIDKNEMEYIEGGYRATREVWVPGGSIRMKTTVYVDTTNAKNSLAGAIITSIIGLIVKPAWAFGFGIAGGIIGALGNTAEKAREMDAADGLIDNMLTVSWSGRWGTEINPYPPNSWEGANF